MLLGISLVLVSVGLGLVGKVLLSSPPPARPVRRREPMPARQMPVLRLSPAPLPSAQRPSGPSRHLPTPTPLLPTPVEPHERVTEPGLPAVEALGDAPTGPTTRDDARDFFTRPTRTLDAEGLRQLRAEAATRPVRLAALAEATSPLRRR